MLYIKLKVNNQEVENYGKFTSKRLYKRKQFHRGKCARHARVYVIDYIAMARRNQNAEHRELLKQIFADPALLKQTLDGDFLPQAYKDWCAKNGTSIHDIEHGMEWAIKRLLGTV